MYGYTYYYDIHLYLLSTKENKKNPIYPQNINNKSTDEIESENKCFRNVCLNYELNTYLQWIMFQKVEK